MLYSVKAVQFQRARAEERQRAAAIASGSLLVFAGAFATSVSKAATTSSTKGFAE